MSRVKAASANLQGSDAQTARQPLPEWVIGGKADQERQALAATPTPAPTVASFSGDLTVPSVTAPASGVWARVFYPGEYVGYFSANGRAKEVNSTGDQFFQLAMSDGSIDGIMEKQDYSGRNMAVQIYKDGILVTNLNTTAPHGYIDLHTRW